MTTSETLTRRLERESKKVEILERIIEEKTREIFSEQQRLKSLNSYLNNVLETMMSALIVTDDQYRVERINQMAQRLLGWDVFEILGMPLAQCLPLEEVAPTSQLAEAGVLQVETWVSTKDGLKVPVLASSSLIWNEQTGASSLVCVLVDLRQRKHMEMQLLQTQKLESVGQLAAGIAHEINTPIQFIGDNLKFLDQSVRELLPVLKQFEAGQDTEDLGKKSAELLAGLRAHLEKIDFSYLRDEMPSAINQSLQGVDRVAKIVRAMKEFSHPGKETKQTIDLQKLVESTLTISTNEWKYNAEVSTTFEEGLPLVPALPGELSQALLNLIINGAHTIGDANELLNRKKGCLAVSTAREGNFAVVKIQDDGMGIPEEIRHRVFEPFFTTKDVGRGTGQGLAIARSIVVDKHGGELQFETEKGKGTTFIIKLPLTAEAAHA